MTDTELACLEQLYRAHSQKLYLYARAILKNDHLAEEAVQDTFHIACIKIQELMRSENPAGWLVQTLKYVIRNMERTLSSLCSSLQNQRPYEEGLLGGRRDEEDVELLYRGLLSEEDFRLLKCIAVDGWSMQEPAQEFGISLEACRKRFQRIRTKMRKNLKL